MGGDGRRRAVLASLDMAERALKEGKSGSSAAFPRRGERLHVRGNARAAPTGAIGAQAVGASAIAASAIGALALGALALGALALGALVVGRVAVGRFAVGSSRLRRLEIEELRVRRLHVEELRVARDKSRVPDADLARAPERSG